MRGLSNRRQGREREERNWSGGHKHRWNMYNARKMWSRVSRVRLEPVYLEWNETVSVRVGPVKENRSPSAAPSRRLNCRIVERLANLRSVEATCPPDTGTLYCPLPCRNRGAAPGAHHPNKPTFSHITLAERSSSETVIKKNFGLCQTPGDPG